MICIDILLGWTFCRNGKAGASHEGRGGIHQTDLEEIVLSFYSSFTEF